MKRVLLAAPVRNRAWVLPAYLEALAALRIPQGVQLSALFVLNGSKDKSGEMLARFQSAMAERMPVEIAEHPDAPPAHEGRRHDDRQRIYAYLAGLRNTLAERALSGGYDYLFSVDSDILLPADALEQLLAAERDAIAAVIYNDEYWSFPPEYRQTNMLMRSDMAGPRGESVYEHMRGFPADQVFEVDLTGACILIARHVLKAGVRYADHHFGEDTPFCEAARAQGFRLWGHGGVLARHMMSHRAWLAEEWQARLEPNMCILERTQGATSQRLQVKLSPGAVEAVLDQKLAAVFLEEVHKRGVPSDAILDRFVWDRARNVVTLELHRSGPPGAQIADFAGQPTGAAAPVTAPVPPWVAP